MLENGKYKEIQAIAKLTYKETGMSFKEIARKKAIYENSEIIDILGVNDTQKVIIDEMAKEMEIDPKELKAFVQMQDAKRKKKKSIEKEIKKAIEYGFTVIFATLTFNDKYIKLKERTRRNYVKNYLEQYPGYIANIDYGEKNEREHYHSIIFIDKNKNSLEQSIKFTKKGNRKVINNFNECTFTNKWEYGFANYQYVQTSEKDKSKIASYINKLTIHALKKGNHRILKNTNKLIDKKNINYEQLKIQ